MAEHSGFETGQTNIPGTGVAQISCCQFPSATIEGFGRQCILGFGVPSGPYGRLECGMSNVESSGICGSEQDSGIPIIPHR
jgi:hypothetical protein